MGLVDKIIMEGLFDDVSDETIARAYIARINRERDGLLEKAVNLPDFRFDLKKNMLLLQNMQPNRCETNTFNFVRHNLDMGKTNMLPVGGFAFTKNFFPVEHWWVYDADQNRCIEVTPVDGAFLCYAGVVNEDVLKEMASARDVFDVDFYKGGNPFSWYFK